MEKLLHIVGSPRKELSRSRIIAERFKEQYIALHPDAIIDVLDLWQDKIPVFDGNKATAKMTFFEAGKLEGEIKTAWNEVLEVTERFTQADDYLITVPMWNGSISWILKQYIDTITQPFFRVRFSRELYKVVA